jgi:hypothetical protein
MPSIHQKNKYSNVQRHFSSCNLAKGERGHREKSIRSRIIEKIIIKYAPIKEHRKKHDPPPK